MRVLIIEDDADLGELLARQLKQHAMIVDLVDRLDDARFIAASERYDAIVLDRMLPDGDGLSVIPDLRRHQLQASIVVLTAAGTVPDRVEGLDAGADDYLVKPFALEELVARIHAVARRGTVTLDASIEIANLRFDPDSRLTTVSNEQLLLPRRELLILAALVRRAGTTVTRSTLEQAAYGLDDDIGPNALDPHISRLRKRLQDAGARVEIHTLRGIGYLLKANR